MRSAHSCAETILTFSSRLPVAAFLTAVQTTAAVAQDPAEVFARYAPSVAKIEVVEPLTSAPRSVGTGFFIDGFGDGVLVTNYHVVSDVVFHPDRRLRLIDGDGPIAGDVEVLAADPAHDLAVIRVADTTKPGLRLTFDSLSVGTRLFSLGHPLDLRTSVVEGIYNGPVEHSISPRFHFTGSINPGMSGGPTVTATGQVVGVNVSTAGDQLSFIIPAYLLEDLMTEALAPGNDADSLAHRLTRRLIAFQDRFFEEFLAADIPTTAVGGIEAPVEPAAVFDCGAEPWDEPDRRYERVDHYCNTFDRISWPDGPYTEFVSFEHIYITSQKLNRFQFGELYTDMFGLLMEWEMPASDETGDIGCRTANVESAGSIVKVVFCARRHEKLTGLYDVLVRTALVGGPVAEGIVGTVRAFGVTFDNAVALYRRLVGRYAWTGA